MTARIPWSDYWLEMAEVVAKRATCNRKQVGAVIVKDNRLLATGYNGSLPGKDHCIDVGCEMEDGHCVRTVHAEVNAIADAARRGIAIEGATMYTTITPCRNCQKVAVSAGMNVFLWKQDYP